MDWATSNDEGVLDHPIADGLAPLLGSMMAEGEGEELGDHGQKEVVDRAGVALILFQWHCVALKARLLVLHQHLLHPVAAILHSILTVI